MIKDAVLAFLLFTGVVLMMVKRFLGTCAFGIAAAAGICAQTSAPPALLDDGRRLVAQLKLVPTADDVHFQTTGLDRSNQ